MGKQFGMRKCIGSSRPQVILSCFSKVAGCFKFLACHMVGGSDRAAAGFHTLTVKAPIRTL